MARLCMPMAMAPCFASSRPCCVPFLGWGTSRAAGAGLNSGGGCRSVVMRKHLVLNAGSRVQLQQQSDAELESDEGDYESDEDDEEDEEDFNESDFEELSIEEDDHSSEEHESSVEQEINTSDEEDEEEEEEEEREEKIFKGGRRNRRRQLIQMSTRPQVPAELLPKVAILGRPNVGKSSLFNRLIRKNIAVVHSEPGVTRDRLYGRVCWEEQEFLLADTGGVLSPSDIGDNENIAGGADALAQYRKNTLASGIPSMIEQQAAIAVEEASAIIFVVDGQAGVTAADIEIADWLRRKHSHKKIVLAVNKCESPTMGLVQTAEFWSLGYTPIALSTITALGVAELLDEVTSDMKNLGEEAKVPVAADPPLAVAIIGRPNVGKSSILNALVGDERAIVSPVSGTTRDAIDTDLKGPDGKIFRLIDTAGIRRRTKVGRGGSKTEALCVKSAMKAIRRADVVALIIEATLAGTEQDLRLGELIEKEGKACVLVVNKWDTVPKKPRIVQEYEDRVREKIRCLEWAQILFTSAINGEKVHKILHTVVRAAQQREKRITTSILNQVVSDAVAVKQPPGLRSGKKGRIYFCTQAATRPPTFIFFVNNAKLFADDYKRHIEKQLRQNIGFAGTPIRMFWRGKKQNPFSGKKKKKVEK